MNFSNSLPVRQEILEAEIQGAVNLWKERCPGYSLNPGGYRELGQWISKFSLCEVLTAMYEASMSLKYEPNGKPTLESVNACFNKIPGYVVVARRAVKDPNAKRLFYTRGILKNRLAGTGRYYDPARALALLKTAVRRGVSLDELEDMTKAARNWKEFSEEINRLIEEVG